MKSPRVLVAVAALFGAAAFTGCTPSCDEMCRKLDRCELLDDATRDECETSCDRELADVKDTDADEDAPKVFRAERGCIGTSSCDEIAAGVCHDPALFPFEG